MIHNQNKNSLANAASTTAPLSVCLLRCQYSSNENGDTLDSQRSTPPTCLTITVSFKRIAWREIGQVRVVFRQAGLICDVTPSGVTFCVMRLLISGFKPNLIVLICDLIVRKVKEWKRRSCCRLIIVQKRFHFKLNSFLRMLSPSHHSISVVRAPPTFLFYFTWFFRMFIPTALIPSLRSSCLHCSLINNEVTFYTFLFYYTFYVECLF